MRVRQVKECKADAVAKSRLENFSYDLRFGDEDVRLSDSVHGVVVCIDVSRGSEELGLGGRARRRQI